MLSHVKITLPMTDRSLASALYNFDVGRYLLIYIKSSQNIRFCWIPESVWWNIVHFFIFKFQSFHVY